MGEEAIITVWEHFILFAAVSLLVSLVYSGLRQDRLKEIVFLGLKRFIFFMGVSAVFAVAVYYMIKNGQPFDVVTFLKPKFK